MTNYRNFTTDELVKLAEQDDNGLALALLAKLEDEVTDKLEEAEETLSEVVKFHADKVEEAIEEYNKQQLKPDSDNIGNYVDCMSHDISEHQLEQVIDEMERNGNCVTEETMDYLLAVLEDSKARDELIEAIEYDIDHATTVEVTRSYYRTRYSITGLCLGEDEIELEHWLDDVPEEICEKVVERLTGYADNSFFYIDNSDVCVNLVLDFDWLEEWVKEHKEQQAA